MFDGKAFGEEIVGQLRSYVDRAVGKIVQENADLRDRLAALELVTPVRGDPGPQGDPGEGVDHAVVAEMVEASVGRAVAAIPPAERGERGESIDPAAVAEMVEASVARAIATIPAAERGEPGKAGEPGKDGSGIGDLLIDRDGALVATFTDGRLKNLGPVIGRDGKAGTDGRDGMGPEDINLRLMEDGRTVRLAFAKGDTEYAFQIPFPVVLDRGVFAEGASYVEGDAVSWGGSLWIAQRETEAKPDGPDSGWRLAVKRGRDGRDKQ